MKKIYLILFFLTLAIGIQAQSGYYNANGFTWRYNLDGNEASIIGIEVSETTRNNFAGTLNIPDEIVIGSVHYSVTSIGDNSLRDFHKATGLHLPQHLKTIGKNAFESWRGLVGPLSIPNGVTEIKDGAFGNCYELTGALVIPDNVETIGWAAFAGCKKLTSLVIGRKVKVIELNAFGGCEGFTGTLTIPANVRKIGDSAFNGCKGFNKLNIMEGVTDIGEWAFANCGDGFSGDLIIPNSVINIGASAFHYDYGFKKLVIGNNVQSIGNGAFSSCTGLTGSVNIPDNVTELGNYAFSSCSSLTGPLTIGNGITKIGDGVFYACTSLSGNLNIPNNITSIGVSAFRECRNLSGTLIIPNSVTEIKFGAFSGCSGFTGPLIIPSSVSTIGIGAFMDCLKLESVTFEIGSNATLSNSAFSGCYMLKYIDAYNLTSPITQPMNRTAPLNIFDGTMDYTMVYLPAGSASPVVGQENFVIGNVCDNFVVYNHHYTYAGFKNNIGCDYPILHPFTATKASFMDCEYLQPQNNRRLSGITCKTLCLPYPATLPNGMRAYELKAKIGGGTYFRFVSIGDGGTQLEANKPYLIRVIDGGISVFSPDNNVQVPVTPPTIEVPATADGTIFFGGTTVNIDNATAAAGGYYNLESNTWKPIKTDNPNGYVHSFRAYIRSTSPTPAKGFAIVLDDENETTGIDNAEEDIEKGDGKIYSLDGKLLGTDVDALKSGEIYIKNGKKFYKF